MTEATAAPPEATTEDIEQNDEWLARREKTMSSMVKFGGTLEKHVVGKDDIKFTVSVPRNLTNLENLAEVYGNREGCPGVDIVALKAELEEDLQGELDLSGDDGGDDEHCQEEIDG